MRQNHITTRRLTIMVAKAERSRTNIVMSLCNLCYRKYRWTLSLWTMTGSEHQIPLATLNSAATLRGRSYATGATCWPIRADQSPSGTRYRKYPRRTNWVASTAHAPIRFRQTGSGHVSRSVKVFPVRLQQGSRRFDLVTYLLVTFLFLQLSESICCYLRLLSTYFSVTKTSLRRVPPFSCSLLFIYLR